MGILSNLTGDTVPFRWTFTEQRAFEDIKKLTQQARDHRRTPLNYAEGASPIWMVTDGSSTGISGVISQGNDWKTAKVSAFYSAKLNSAQQNYPVHEIEMLAGIETMLRHADILHGTKFKWLTDHKGLIYLLNQKNLSGRQARWLEKISSFDFEVVYVPGTENILADALSRIYSDDPPTVTRSLSEYTYHDIVLDDLEVESSDGPILANVENFPMSTRLKKVLPTAETGRPETAREFASRTKDHFVLKGPRERKEGGNTEKNQNQTINKLTIRIKPKNTENATNIVNTPTVQRETQEGTQKEFPTLPQMLTQSMTGIDLVREIRGKYKSDSFFNKIVENPKSFRNFVEENGLIYLKEKEKRLLCIPKILIEERNAREVVISEAHSMLAHLGTHKTLNYIRDHVWWKEMVADVQSFCESCTTCKRSKPSNQKPYGLLNPLPIPGNPWESIGVDFIGPLPESKNRDSSFDSITVVICLLTGMVHLTPSRTNYNARQMAELMFEEIYKHHGLPNSIISDRDVLFTSTFWEHLHQLLGTQLRMSSAYHPQTDGATERANRTVTQMLRQCINNKQTDWVSKLPAVEFAINSARSESTGYAPFFLNSGRMPRPMIWNSAPKTEYPSIRNFALQKKLALMSAHDSILAARVKQTRNANRKRQIEPFKEEELVYISTKNITFPKGLARKLIPKYIGPYKIVKDFGNHSFRIDLPTSLRQRGIHDVFHSSLLRIHHPNDDRLFPGRLDSQIGQEYNVEAEWTVDKILSHSGSGEESAFEIKWKAGDITWLPYNHVNHLQALSDYLDLLGVDSISLLPTGNGKSPEIFIGYIGVCPGMEQGPETHINPSQVCPPFPLLPHLPTSNSSTMPRGNHTKKPYYSDRRPKPSPARHPNFQRAENRFVIRDTSIEPPRLLSTSVADIQHCLEVDRLARTDAQRVLNQPIPIVYDTVARAFNVVMGSRRFATINYQTGEIEIDGEAVLYSDLGIEPNESFGKDPDGFTADETAAANKMFRQTYTHHLRKKNFSIAERQKKLERVQMERVTAQFQPKNVKATAKVRYTNLPNPKYDSESIFNFSRLNLPIDDSIVLSDATSLSSLSSPRVLTAADIIADVVAITTPPGGRVPSAVPTIPNDQPFQITDNELSELMGEPVQDMDLDDQVPDTDFLGCALSHTEDTIA
jgi:hypothetical protein